MGKKCKSYGIKIRELTKQMEDRRTVWKLWIEPSESCTFRRWRRLGHSPQQDAGRSQEFGRAAQGGLDGWFLSDFFAFWNVLQGMTFTQTCLLCLDLDEFRGG